MTQTGIGTRRVTDGPRKRVRWRHVPLEKLKPEEKQGTLETTDWWDPVSVVYKPKFTQTNAHTWVGMYVNKSLQAGTSRVYVYLYTRIDNTYTFIYTCAHICT